LKKQHCIFFRISKKPLKAVLCEDPSAQPRDVGETPVVVNPVNRLHEDVLAIHAGIMDEELDTQLEIGVLHCFTKIPSN